MDLPCTPVRLSTNASSVLAQAVSPSLSGSVPGQAGFVSSYDEFRIVGITFKYIPAATTPSAGMGLLKLYLDDSDATAPTATTAASRGGHDLTPAASNAKSYRTIKYRCENFADLTWLECSTQAAYTPCSLKAYYTTGAVAYNSSDLGWVIPTLHIQFRGIGGT